MVLIRVGSGIQVHRALLYTFGHLTANEGRREEVMGRCGRSAAHPP